MTREEFLSYCLDEYAVTPDYPWIKDPETAVLRHENNKKWFALVMDIPKSKLGINSNDIAEESRTLFGFKGNFRPYLR